MNKEKLFRRQFLTKGIRAAAGAFAAVASGALAGCDLRDLKDISLTFPCFSISTGNELLPPLGKRKILIANRVPGHNLTICPGALGKSLAAVDAPISQQNSYIIAGEPFYEYDSKGYPVMAGKEVLIAWNWKIGTPSAAAAPERLGPITFNADFLFAITLAGELGEKPVGLPVETQKRLARDCFLVSSILAKKNRATALDKNISAIPIEEYVKDAVENGLLMGVYAPSARGYSRDRIIQITGDPRQRIEELLPKLEGVNSFPVSLDPIRSTPSGTRPIPT